MRGGHECVVYDVNADAVDRAGERGRDRRASLDEFVRQARAAARGLDHGAGRRRRRRRSTSCAAGSSAGDIIIDGGNSYYRDDIAAPRRCGATGIHYVDVGTSGGVFGLERGYCLMIGGDDDVVARLDPIFATLAPGVDAAPRTPGRDGEPAHRRAGLPALRAARRRPLREDGPQRHRVRAHGGLRRGPQHPAQRERRRRRTASDDAETTPLRDPRVLPVRPRPRRRRRGVAARQRRRSWLLDLTAAALRQRPGAREFAGRVSDSGEGRWTIHGGDRRGRAGAGARAALFERFTLARRGRLRRPAALGDAQASSAATSRSRLTVQATGTPHRAPRQPHGRRARASSA